MWPWAACENGSRYGSLGPRHLSDEGNAETRFLRPTADAAGSLHRIVPGGSRPEAPRRLGRARSGHAELDARGHWDWGALGGVHRTRFRRPRQRLGDRRASPPARPLVVFRSGLLLWPARLRVFVADEPPAV